MTRTTAHLSRRLGIDPAGTLRWQDIDGLAYEVISARKHTGLGLDFAEPVPSQMPYAVNDYDQQPLPISPMQEPTPPTDYATLQEGHGLDMLKCATITAVLLLVLSLLSFAISGCTTAKVSKTRRPALGLLQDREQPTPKYGWFPSDARP